MILAMASGAPAHQLDLWMAGQQHCRALLYEAARNADLILIEGVMGLFDGHPSSADIAQMFAVPVVAVVDVHGMAETFNAVTHGLKTYRPGLPFAGCIANGVASARHAEMIIDRRNDSVPCLCALPRDISIAMPERHLGLVQAGEIADLEERLDTAGNLIKDAGMTSLPEPVEFEPVEFEPVPPLLSGIRIAVARDSAFSFLYDDNLELLKEMEASICFFSPLNNDVIADVDAIYLPGGYPELHLSVLAGNTAVKEWLRKHFSSGKKIYAECGGMLYLLETLTATDGECAEMVGLIPGDAVMQDRLCALGYQYLDFPQGRLHGHTFHHSLTRTTLKPSLYAVRKRNQAQGEAVFTTRGLTATYIHAYFRSHPRAAASLFADLDAIEA